MLTSRNIFIANLAISDILLCSFTMPLTLVDLLTKYWALGQNMVWQQQTFLLIMLLTSDEGTNYKLFSIFSLNISFPVLGWFMIYSISRIPLQGIWDDTIWQYIGPGGNLGFLWMKYTFDCNRPNLIYNIWIQMNLAYFIALRIEWVLHAFIGLV